MSIKLQLPKLTDLTPRLTVVGVGGAGCNAVNNMILAGLTGVEFVVANTDAQSLAASSAEHRIQLGAALTEGLGAGSKPEIGEAAAEEALEDIRAHVAGSHMVFIAAGMGGGTGTGAASVIARVAREQGILTVGVVTKPFQFEGARRMRIAEAGIQELKKSVDTLIVIPNQNLFRVANEKTTFAEAFILADQVLYSGVACIVDLIVKEGLINLDFADVRTVMSGMGTAMMGTGEASGDRRAIMAAEEAISNPLLDDVSLKGARGLLLSITGGRDLTLYEVDEAASRVRQEVDQEANIIVGATFDDTLGDRVRVSIVASGMLRPGEVPVVPGAASEPRSSFGARPEPIEAPAAVAPPPMVSPPAMAVAPPPAPVMPPMAPQPAPVAVAAPAVLPPLAEGPPPVYQPVYEPEPARSLPEPMPYDGAAGYQQPQAAHASYAPRLDEERDMGLGSRETWRAPGNVVIEEGLPNLGAPSQQVGQQVSPRNAALDQPPLGHAQAPAHGAAHDFTPAAPAEIRRPPVAQRRMPDVEDFPVVGQRDYRAKTEPRASEAPPPIPAPASAGEPRRKAGFFERLTGRGGRQDDETNHYASSAGGARSQGRQGNAQQTPERSRSPAAQAGDRGAQRGPGRDGEDAELPVFFNRERK